MADTPCYTPPIENLLAIPVEVPLRVSSELPEGVAALKGLQASSLFDGAELADPEMANAVLAAFYLRFGALDAAHELINAIDSPTGALWHGILHRMEGDYPNARYWMHQAGNHPTYTYLAQGAGAILAQMSDLDSREIHAGIRAWDAMYFTKLCERALQEGSDLQAFCSQVQDLEWKVLFHFSYQSAIGEF